VEVVKVGHEELVKVIGMADIVVARTEEKDVVVEPGQSATCAIQHHTTPNSQGVGYDNHPIVLFALDDHRVLDIVMRPTIYWVGPDAYPADQDAHGREWVDLVLPIYRTSVSQES
jgi:hypothetical protein